MEKSEALKQENSKMNGKEEILDYFKFSKKNKEEYLKKFKDEKQKNIAVSELDRIEQQINKELDEFKKEKNGQVSQDEVDEFLCNFLDENYKDSDIYDEIFMNKHDKKSEKEPAGVKLKLVKSGEKPPLENFQEKYGKIIGKNLFENGDPEKNWIYIAEEYDLKAGEVKIFDSSYEKGEKSRRIKFNELDKLLEKYKFAEIKKEEPKKIRKKSKEQEKKETEKEPEIRKMEDVEKERARKAQEEIEKIEEEENKIDLATPKGRQKYIESQESDLEKAQREYKEESDEAKILEIRDAKPEKDIPLDDLEKEVRDLTENGIDGRENLEKLRQEVEKARKEYLEVDYKKNNAFKRLYKFFGGAFKNKEERIRENDQDIAWYRAYYDNALFNYKNAVLEDAKNRKVSNKELGEVLKFFETEAKVNIAEGHDQVKAENQDYKLAKYFNGKISEMIQGYRKLPMAKKIAIGAAFGIGAFGAGMTGSALVIGTVASAATIRKIFMGMVTGTGAALFAEKLTQKNREKSIEKEVSGFEKEIEETKDKEYVEERLKYKIDNLIYDEDQKINTVKNKNLRNLGIGVGVGLASSVLIPEFVKHGKEWFSHLGAGNKVIEHFTAHRVAGAGVSGHENINQSEPGIAKNIVQPVHEGSSFQGSIIKHLESSGMDHKQAGTEAHKMWMEYVKTHPDIATKNYNLIHPDAKIELSPDGKHIVGFHDSPKAEWIEGTKTHADVEHHHASSAAKGAVSPTHEKIMGNVHENIEKKTFAPKGIDIEERLAEAAKANTPPPPLENPDGTLTKETAAKVAMAGVGGTIAGKKMAENRENKKVINLAEKRKEKRIKEITEKYGFSDKDDLNDRANKIAKRIALGELKNWRLMRGVKMEDILGKKSPLSKELTKNIKALKREWGFFLEEEVNPKVGEVVFQWLARIIKEADKKEK